LPTASGVLTVLVLFPLVRLAMETKRNKSKTVSTPDLVGPWRQRCFVGGLLLDTPLDSLLLQARLELVSTPGHAQQLIIVGGLLLDTLSALYFCKLVSDVPHSKGCAKAGESRVDGTLSFPTSSAITQIGLNLQPPLRGTLATTFSFH
jgi:hypothetical protein